MPENNIPLLSGIAATIAGLTGVVGKHVFVSKKACAATSGKVLDKLDKFQDLHLEEMKEIKHFMGKVETYMKMKNGG